jgi:hypothetical protein
MTVAGRRKPSIDNEMRVKASSSASPLHRASPGHTQSLASGETLEDDLHPVQGQIRNQ